MRNRDTVADGNGGEASGEIKQKFQWAETTPSSAVVQTVATATDTDPTDLVPIQHSVDADALDTLFAQASPESHLRISFEYAGRVVTVTGNGVVTVSLEELSSS